MTPNGCKVLAVARGKCATARGGSPYFSHLCLSSLLRSRRVKRDSPRADISMSRFLAAAPQRRWLGVELISCPLSRRSPQTRSPRAPSRHARARADGNGVDGGGGQLREHGGIGPPAVRPFLRVAKAGGERLVEFNKAFEDMARISGSATASEAAVITVRSRAAGFTGR